MLRPFRASITPTPLTHALSPVVLPGTRLARPARLRVLPCVSVAFESGAPQGSHGITRKDTKWELAFVLQGRIVWRLNQVRIGPLVGLHGWIDPGARYNVCRRGDTLMRRETHTLSPMAVSIPGHLLEAERSRIARAGASRPYLGTPPS